MQLNSNLNTPTTRFAVDSYWFAHLFKLVAGIDHNRVITSGQVCKTEYAVLISHRRKRAKVANTFEIDFDCFPACRLTGREEDVALNHVGATATRQTTCPWCLRSHKRCTRNNQSQAQKTGTSKYICSHERIAVLSFYLLPGLRLRRSLIVARTRSASGAFGVKRRYVSNCSTA